MIKKYKTHKIRKYKSNNHKNIITEKQFKERKNKLKELEII